LIIAHRGASHYFHENTLAAFEAAIDMSAEMIEFDVRRTADGVLVIHHDHDFDGAKIMAMEKAQIEERSTSAGYAIPTLVEVLKLCEGKLPLDIELKEPGYEEQVLETVLGILDTDGFLITSNFDFVLRRIKELNPTIRTGLIIGNRPRWQLLTRFFPGRRARRAGVDLLVVSQKLVELGFLFTTRNLGLPVWVYTVNDRRELWKYITDGRVGGMFSDRPDIALFLRDLNAVENFQNSEFRIQEPEKETSVGVSE
jgi:glycerophosphoryl diester phosphodiesterase